MKIKYYAENLSCITPCPYRKDIKISSLQCLKCKWYDKIKNKEYRDQKEDTKTFVSFRKYFNYVFCKRHSREKILEAIEQL